MQKWFYTVGLSFTLRLSIISNYEVAPPPTEVGNSVHFSALKPQNLC